MMRAFLFLFLCCVTATVHAEAPSLQAGFAPNTASVGETIRFNLVVNGGEDLDRPPQIKIDGLSFEYLGQNSQSSLSYDNGNIARHYAITHVYQVTPQRAGEFTVPAMILQVGARRLGTQPVALTVLPGGAPNRPDRNAMAEIVVSKKTAYVGEALPCDVRLSLDQEIRYRLENLPKFESEAFTRTKLAEGRTTTVTRGGRTYEITSFRTVLTPTKAGSFGIGPAAFQYVAQIPRAQPVRPRSGGILDLLGDPSMAFSQAQRYTATSDAVEMTIKPLPAAGRPASFAGAVGRFTMTSQGTPARLKMGDPLMMKVTISGSGNFDRVNAPVLTEAAGWRAYPPNSTYKGDDNLGLNGAKSFEMAVIPEEKKDAMPEYEFSYFDPAEEKYVTLHTEHTPLQVEGSAPLATAPEVRGPAREPAAVAPTPPPVVKPMDIVGIRYDLGPLHASQPLYTQRAFLLAQLAPLGLLCGLVAVRFWPRDRSGPAGALRRERAALLAGMKREAGRAAFFASAARICEIETSLRGSEAAEAPMVREIMETHAHARYSGAETGPAEKLLSEERQRILQGLQPLLSAR